MNLDGAVDMADGASDKDLHGRKHISTVSRCKVASEEALQLTMTMNASKLQTKSEMLL